MKWSGYGDGYRAPIPREQEIERRVSALRSRIGSLRSEREKMQEEIEKYEREIRTLEQEYARLLAKGDPQMWLDLEVA